MKIALRQKLSCVMVAACLGSVAALSASPVLAEAPAQQKTQVPGYYRMMLGDFEVTALYDGYVDLATSLLKGMDEKDLQSLLARMFLRTTPGVQTSVNAFLVNTGSHLVLVDAGTAQCFGSSTGHILENIRAAGYRPQDIDTVLLTHLHPDHACGIAQNGKMAFPNVTVYVGKAEADFWLNPANSKTVDASRQGLFAMAQAAVAPYQAANKLKFYQQEDALLAGVQVIATPGHTPGHSSYLFTSKDQSLLLWGDLVHSHSVQFSHPEVALEFDSNQPQAIETRRKVLADAARSKLWVGGAHLPFPGLGHVRADADSYAWVPIEYGPIRSDR
ncbi:MBL fold metallo-hydrolase [Neisseriaceae bacterium TC5R-5]|nr:MBL fold metallo-hydrolase [Neisseriaceae bacterium TC5R-5]